MKEHMAGEGESFEKNMQVGCFIFVIVIGFFCIRRMGIFQPQSVVLPAISKDMANGMTKENECYIVRIEDPEKANIAGWEFTDWYYVEGKEKTQITLLGQSPANELSYIFMEPNRNSFLVRGYVHDELTAYHNRLVLFVEEWYLVEPIKRDYGADDYRQEQRLFYPGKYLDAYDVEQGDYCPVNTYDLTWDSSETYYLSQEGYQNFVPDGMEPNGSGFWCMTGWLNWIPERTIMVRCVFSRMAMWKNESTLKAILRNICLDLKS